MAAHVIAASQLPGRSVPRVERSGNHLASRLHFLLRDGGRRVRFSG